MHPGIARSAGLCLFAIWLTSSARADPFPAPSAAGIHPPSHASELERGRRGAKWIALTFDAGGEATAFPQLVRGLAGAHVRCTFFVTGSWAHAHPDLIRQLGRDGHEIGNHSRSHADLTGLSDETIREEVGARANCLGGCWAMRRPGCSARRSAGVTIVCSGRLRPSDISRWRGAWTVSTRSETRRRRSISFAALPRDPTRTSTRDPADARGRTGHCGERAFDPSDVGVPRIPVRDAIRADRLAVNRRAEW